MEKFTNWRDKATGITPFMPISDASQNSALKSITKALTFIFKLPVLLIVSILYLLTSFIPPLNDLIVTLLGLKLLIHVAEPELVVDGIKKSNVKATNESKPQKGDVCIVNLSSPLDGYTLKSISLSQDIVFVLVDESGSLVKLSGGASDIYKFAITGGTTRKGLSTSKIDDLTGYKSKLVILFIEGTTSNNKAIITVNKNLPLISKLIDLSAQKLKIISLSTFPASLTTTPVPTSSLKFIYGLITASVFSNSVKSKLRLFNIDSETAAKITHLQIREKLSNYGNLKLTGTDLDIQGKLDFIEAMKKAGKL